LEYNLTKTEVQEMAAFFENLSGRNAFEFVDGSDIYRDQSGFIEDYSLRPLSVDAYSMRVNAVVVTNAPILSWSGKSFVNESAPTFSVGAFETFDVTFSGGASDNQLNNFFYYTGAGGSVTAAEGPLQASTLFSNEFSLFKPDVVSSIDVEPSISVVDFKNSFPDRVKTKKNIHSIRSIKLNFKNRTNKETKALLHFLEGKAGYRRFRYDMPDEVLNRPKVWYSPSWQHTWNYYDSNNVSVELVEDPLGIIPDETRVT
jgi:phage-related protein